MSRKIVWPDEPSDHYPQDRIRVLMHGQEFVLVPCDHHPIPCMTLHGEEFLLDGKFWHREATT